MTIYVSRVLVGLEMLGLGALAWVARRQYVWPLAQVAGVKSWSAKSQTPSWPTATVVVASKLLLSWYVWPMIVSLSWVGEVETVSRSPSLRLALSLKRILPEPAATFTYTSPAKAVSQPPGEELAYCSFKRGLEPLAYPRRSVVLTWMSRRRRKVAPLVAKAAAVLSAAVSWVPI